MMRAFGYKTSSLSCSPLRSRSPHLPKSFLKRIFSIPPSCRAKPAATEAEEERMATEAPKSGQANTTKTPVEESGSKTPKTTGRKTKLVTILNCESKDHHPGRNRAPCPATLWEWDQGSRPLLIRLVAPALLPRRSPLCLAAVAVAVALAVASVLALPLLKPPLLLLHPLLHPPFTPLGLLLVYLLPQEAILLVPLVGLLGLILSNPRPALGVPVLLVLPTSASPLPLRDQSTKPNPRRERRGR